MEFFTHEDLMKEIFSESPEIKELYEKEKLNYTISLQLKGIREKKRISQFDLAKKIWTTQSIIARIESWNSNISMKTLWKVLWWLWATIKIES